MPHKFIFEVKFFDVWGIDFMGPFSHHSRIKISVVVDYVSKWALGSPTNNARCGSRNLHSKNL